MQTDKPKRTANELQAIRAALTGLLLIGRGLDWELLHPNMG
jgi:hypothetical protein